MFWKYFGCNKSHSIQVTLDGVSEVDMWNFVSQFRDLVYIEHSEQIEVEGDTVNIVFTQDNVSTMSQLVQYAQECGYAATWEVFP